MLNCVRYFGIAAIAAGFLAAAPVLAQTVTPEEGRVLQESSELLHSGREQDAINELRDTLMRFPQSAMLHFQLGNALSDTKNYDEAFNEYSVALKINPHFPAAELNISYCLVNQKKYEESLPWFEQLFKDSPNAPNKTEIQSQYLMAKAAVSSSKGRFFDAKNFLQQAIDMNPSSPTLHFKLARACDELGDTKRAISEYQQVLAIKPDFHAAIFNIAGCYQSMGQPHESIKWFQMYLDKEPNAQDRGTIINMIAKLKEKSNGLNADPHEPDYMHSIVENGHLYRWAQEHFPLKVYIDFPANEPTMKESYKQFFIESMSAWSVASQNKLSFLLIPDRERADIVCVWTGNPYEVRQTGSDVEQGVTQMQVRASNKQFDALIDHANIRILTIDRETGQPLNDDDMKKTCLHELGHALGLRGHSSNNHDIMFFSVSPTVWPVLSKRDKSTILTLYNGYREIGAAPPSFSNVIRPMPYR